MSEGRAMLVVCIPIVSEFVSKGREMIGMQITSIALPSDMSSETIGMQTYKAFLCLLT
jgi:hypothetical protein